MPFTALDIVMLVIVFFICIRAAIKGLIDEVFGLGTFVLGAFLAFKFMNKLQPYMAKSMNPTLASILSFVILFVIVFLIMKIIQLALKSVFSGSILTSLDHGLGFIFGIAEGVFIVVLIFILMEILQAWINTDELRKASYLYNLLHNLIETTGSTIMEHI